MPTRPLIDRMRGAAMLDVPTYEEVEADLTATGQAAMVVAIVAVCAAIGGARGGHNGVIGGLIGAFLSWLVWSGVTYLVGTRVFRGTATWGELLRTVGFAQAPGVLYVLGVIPGLGRLVVFAVQIWTLIAGIVAIRQALDISTGQAVVTAILSVLALMLIGMVLGIFGIGLFALGAASGAVMHGF